MITWDILTATVPHRHDKLCALLKVLDQQMRPGAGMILYRDNFEVSYGDKTRMLTEASQADYVSNLDDDDSVAEDFVPRMLGAMADGPDYIGFAVRWTQNGMPQRPVYHSLEYGGWQDGPALERDITQFNPIKRELAMPEAWNGGWEADRRWSDAVRASGKVKTQVFVAAEMHHYQENTHDSFRTPRSPWTGAMPELPSYPWLRQIGPYA